MFQGFATLLIAGMLLPSSLPFFTNDTQDFAFPIALPGQPPLPVRIENDSLGLNTSARSILVTDHASGLGLYSKDPAGLRSIASITKLMTALVWLKQNPDWDEIVTIRPEDARAGGRVYLVAGDRVRARDLFYLTLVASSNEAAAALARITPVENFVTQMNATAEQLGMTRSYFQEPTGLHAGNVSTALDLILLADAAFEREEIAEAAQYDRYVFAPLGRASQVAESTDQLLGSFLNRDGFRILGAKTGYLDNAGYCLLLRVRAPGGQELTVAILGSESAFARWQETKGLVSWVLENYTWPAAEQ